MIINAISDAAKNQSNVPKKADNENQKVKSKPKIPVATASTPLIKSAATPFKASSEAKSQSSSVKSVKSFVTVSRCTKLSTV